MNNQKVYNELDLNLSLLENYKGDLFCGVDVGGTNTRVSISGEDIFSPLMEYKFLSSTKETLLNTLFQIEESLKNKCFNNNNTFKIKASVLAIAGPISRFETFATVTNYKANEESGRELDIEELPFILFPRNTTKLINDLKGTCLGLIALHHSHKLKEYFSFGWNKNNQETIHLDNRYSYMVMAVGTGLGTAAIVSLSETQFEIVPLEGGHTTMFHCTSNNQDYQNETKLFKYLQEEVWEGKYQPEFEDILSGRGIESLYKYFTKDLKDAPTLKADKISDTAITNSSNHSEEIRNVCKEVLMSYYKFYARASKNFSILLQTKGGIFWAGDNLTTNYSFIKDNIECFQKEFLDSPKLNWIENIPLYLQTERCNFNLFGALYYARKNSSLLSTF